MASVWSRRVHTMARTIMAAVNEGRRRFGLRKAVYLAVLGAVVVLPMRSMAVLDICGCAGDPTLHAFDANDQSTYPPGSVVTGSFTGRTLTIPLPADGVLKFSSFTI